MGRALPAAAMVLPALLALPLCADSQVDDHTGRIHESAIVLAEIMRADAQRIPQDLLERAQCVGIVPGVKRAGFISGGKYGKGVLTCRTRDTAGWSAPSTIRIEGGGIGFQIGAGETDIVFVVMNRRGVDRMMEDEFTVGGDASAMAGPVGRSAEARTDAMLHAEILSWSRSRGVFAGVSLEGATLCPDNGDNEKIYSRRVTQREILSGSVPPPGSAAALFDELNRYAPYKKS